MSVPEALRSAMSPTMICRLTPNMDASLPADTGPLELRRTCMIFCLLEPACMSLPCLSDNGLRGLSRMSIPRSAELLYKYNLRGQENKGF